MSYVITVRAAMEKPNAFQSLTNFCLEELQHCHESQYQAATVLA